MSPSATKNVSRVPMILLGILAGLQAADPLVCSLSLVKASDELNFSASLQSLAAGISTFALAATVIPAGLLADRAGRRRVLSWAVLVAAAGQVMTALGPDPAVFLAGRIITGVALGAVFSSAYAMIQHIVAPEDRAPAIALFSVVAIIFPLLVVVASGPVAGLNWRLAYGILPLVAVVVFPLIVRLLPEVESVGSGPVDYLGLVLVAVGVAGLLVGISSASRGLGSPFFWGPIAGGVVALIWFARHGSVIANPLFPPKIFTHPAFFAAVLFGILFNFVNGASSQMSANFWQYVTRMPTALVGMASVPVAIFSVIAASIAGRLLKKGTPGWLLAGVGGLVAAVGIGSLVIVGATSPYALFLPMMALCGLGSAAVSVVQGGMFLNLSPAKYFGPVTSVRTAVGQFGYSLGLTGTSVLVSTFTLGGVARIGKGASGDDNNWDAITSFLTTGQTTDTSLSSLGREAIAGAYAQAFALTAAISAVLLALMAAIAIWALRRPTASLNMDAFVGDAAVPTPAKENPR